MFWIVEILEPEGCWSVASTHGTRAGAERAKRHWLFYRGIDARVIVG